MWLYDVPMHSQSITFCRWRSVVPLLEEGGEITAAEISTVLLQTSAAKCFLATYINAYLKKQYHFNCTLKLVFFHSFFFTGGHLFWHYIFSDVVPLYITTPTCGGFCQTAYRSANQLFGSELQWLTQETQENKNEWL